MFNYTHEVIINSNVGTLAGNKRIGTYDDEALGVKHLIIERAGDYRSDLIFPRGEGVVFKTPGYDGQLATLTVTAPDSLTAGDVFQFSVFVKLGVFADELVAALKDAIPFNNKFITVAKNGTSIVLTASMFGMEFESAKLEKLV